MEHPLGVRRATSTVWQRIAGNTLLHLPRDTWEPVSVQKGDMSANNNLVGVASVVPVLAMLDGCNAASGQSEPPHRIAWPLRTCARVLRHRSNTGRLSWPAWTEEGAAARTVAAADIVVAHIEDALDLLLAPARLVATLRTR